MNRVIFVGMPCYDTVAPEILEDFSRFTYYLGRRYTDYTFYLGIRTKSEQFRARNNIVKAAMDIGADYLLMLDDDMVIDIDESQIATNRYKFLEKLIGHIERNPKIGLIGALYYERGNLCRPVLMKKITPVNYEWLTDIEIKGGLQPVDVQGGGCMLINMKVFDWIEGPSYFEPEFVYGTDIQICRKVQEAGFEVWSDTSIELGHLRSQRLIVTSDNRKDLLTLSQDHEDKAIAITQYGRMVNQYRDDIKEYLGVDEKLATESYFEFENLQQKFNEYQDKDQWYIDISKCFLARQIIVNNPEKPSPVYRIVLDTIGTENKFNGLDFACGSSPSGFELAKRGNHMIFCDLPETETFKFLQWRCAKYGIDAKFVDNIENIPDESLDFILALDVIEHFPEDRACELVKKFSKLLRPHGHLICNFLSNLAFEYPEHIFMDKVKFSSWTAENKLFPVSHFQYIKKPEYFGD